LKDKRIINQDMQDENKQLAQEVDRRADAMKHDFEQVKGLRYYDIYRRKHSSKKSSTDKDTDDPS
jgi:hypothetical protein